MSDTLLNISGRRQISFRFVNRVSLLGGGDGGVKANLLRKGKLWIKFFLSAKYFHKILSYQNTASPTKIKELRSTMLQIQTDETKYKHCQTG